MRKLLNLPRFLRWLLGHPLNRHHRGRALLRWLRWQISSSLAPGPIVVPFVGGTRMIVSREMQGAKVNIYTGLAEYEDMAFVLHLLRQGDLFLDVGANVGSYTLLASVTGADIVAVEPASETAARLRDNVVLNGLGDRIQIVEAAMGDANGEISFTRGRDCVNHVATPGEDSIVVPVRTIDGVLRRPPTAIKIDIEGYELPALLGAQRALADTSLLAVIVELNGSGQVYGHSDEDVHKLLAESGFTTATYDPGTRQLAKADGPNRMGNNTLYIRDLPIVSDRVSRADSFDVNGQAI